MAVQQFCLRWNNHQPNFISVFTHLLSTESLVDVTLAAEGKHLQAHRVVLSACSPYFQMLFTMNPCQHPIVILKDVKYDDLKIMIDFMYYGEVNISHEQLPAILKTAELLKVKGLAENSDPCLTKQASGSSDRAELLTPGDSAWDSTSRRSPSPLSTAAKRKRLRKSSTGSGSGSTERGTSEEQLTGEVTLVPSPALIKSESAGYPVVQTSGGGSTDADSGGTGRSADSSLRTGGQEPSTDSEPRNGSGSHDSTDDDPMSIHIPSEGECSSLKVEAAVSEYNQREKQYIHQPHQAHISPQGKISSIKRNRWLVRQPRVKKDGDIGQEESEGAGSTLGACSPVLSTPPAQPTEMMQTAIVTTNTTGQPQPSPPPQQQQKQQQQQPLLLTVPHRVERQSSEPGPSRSSQLLAVPQTPAYLVKQHSDPQIQSVVSIHTPLLTIQRQMSQQHQQTQQQQEQQQQQQQQEHQQHNQTLRHLLSHSQSQQQQPHHQQQQQQQTQTVVQQQVAPFHMQLVSTSAQEPPTRATSPSVVVLGSAQAPQQHTPLPLEHTAVSSAPSSTSLPQQPAVHQELKNVPSGLRVRSDELRRASSSPQETTYECPLRSNHCPALRPGPALGCNYCWNTIDSHGRILRRKTKYYCPECQTNLCIVPCFQAYHERSTAPPSTKILPKTGSI